MDRRGFLKGLAFVAMAPAIVRAESLMKVRAPKLVLANIGEPWIIPVPHGWLPCDGREISRQSYAALFNAIGDVYGGDGVTTFKLPNWVGHVEFPGLAGITPCGQPLIQAVADGELPAGSLVHYLGGSHDPA